MKKFLLLAVLFLGLKVYSQEVPLYSAQILEVKEKFDMKSVSSGTYPFIKGFSSPRNRQILKGLLLSSQTETGIFLPFPVLLPIPPAR